MRYEGVLESESRRSQMTLRYAPLCDRLGVVVEGLDFAHPIEAAIAEQLRALWHQHGLLLVRGEHVTPEAQIAFSRLFGELEAHPLRSIRAQAWPELMELDSRDERTNPASLWNDEPVIGRLPWHKDLFYTTRPNHGAVLRAVHVPATAGETGFGDQQAAWEALPRAMQERLKGLEVVYRFGVSLLDMPFIDTTRYRPGPGVPRTAADVGFPDFPDVVHPLVLRHPVTGRHVLAVSPMFLVGIKGLSTTDSDALCRELVAHVTRPEFCYLHCWTAGEMILWDNWRFMHSAPGISPGDRRLIHRTTIVGDVQLGRSLVP
jgi:taurine dioxygenase